MEPVECRDCPAGYACTNGLLTLCPAGTFSKNSSTLCHHCRPGTITNGTGMTECTACPAGTTSNYGRFACHSCPPGHTSGEV